ncbi:thioredoxin [Acuticoccus sediminis]|uniref:Thioredoxin n=1 Tax=Acuticoccus sediminis TaxID=2184697 RepID=A0A8B2P057_9HYPH|nr:thioredoxin [Acuticoccus sediminis]RAI03344.1 thioredoxin [Acuticoccus sediminis]
MSTLLGPSGLEISSTPGQPAATSGGDVVDTTTQTFMKDVVEASREVPVLVDFWAPWCGPCKQLAPILEKAVKAFKGAVKLVKMNIDEHPEIAGQLGIRSIPAVIAFRNGQPMDGFVGAQTEGQIRTFLERIAGPATDGVAELMEEAAAALEAGQFEQATMLYSEVLQRDPENAPAIAGLGMVSVMSGDIEAAKDLFSQIPDEMRSDPAIESLGKAIGLADQAAALGGTADLQAKVDADPNDHQARLDLAVALAGKGDKAAAVAALIEILRRDREWNEGAARKELMDFFEAWGPKDPATVAGRRKMASILFA